MGAVLGGGGENHCELGDTHAGKLGACAILLTLDRPAVHDSTLHLTRTAQVPKKPHKHRDASTKE